MAGGEIIAIVAILGVLSVVGLTWYSAIRAQARARELLHAERLAAIEKGIALPDEPAEAGGKEMAQVGGTESVQAGGKESPTHALGQGTFLLFLGLGFILSMLVVHPGSTHWGWGIIVVALGLAYLVGHWLTRGKPDEDAAKRDADGK
jgi:hypothetical protein